MGFIEIVIIALTVLGSFFLKNKLRWPRLSAFFSNAYVPLTVAFVAAYVLTKSVTISVVVSLVLYLAIPHKRPTADVQAKPNGSPFGPVEMTVREAYLLLRLPPNATEEDAQAAYRALIKRNHPDQGGSTAFAAKLNEAKTLVLQHIREVG